MEHMAYHQLIPRRQQPGAPPIFDLIEGDDEQVRRLRAPMRDRVEQANVARRELSEQSKKTAGARSISPTMLLAGTLMRDSLRVAA